MTQNKNQKGGEPDPDQIARDWWQTDIIDMAPGEIRYAGYPIEQLIGSISFPQMIWLMTRGALPSSDQARLLEAALVAAVDHGPQAPSIAIARMAATCGVGLNNAMASGLNVLGDVHGGAGEQAVSMYHAIVRHYQMHTVPADSDVIDTESMMESARYELDLFTKAGGKFVPGFGHRFHPIDPRAPRLLALVDAAQSAGTITGLYTAAARAIEACLADGRRKPIPMNIDGATAVIYAELGFPAPLARGLFCLSRSVGLLAHAWEQSQQGGRNKGPLPRHLIWSYGGPAERPVPRFGDSVDIDTETEEDSESNSQNELG